MSKTARSSRTPPQEPGERQVIEALFKNKELDPSTWSEGIFHLVCVAAVRCAAGRVPDNKHEPVAYPNHL
jgi:hypothetical protein